jgi:hypothetical protein
MTKTLPHEDVVIIAMTKSLEPLWSDEMLACDDARTACYIRAAIDPADIKRYDAQALKREQIRRKLFAATAQKVA